MTSSVTNYFKSFCGAVFFFVDSIPESVEEAYGAVLHLDSEPSVYRPVGVSGDWDRCKIIGHRSYSSIRQDLASVEKREDREQLEDELAALHYRYAAAGRTTPQVNAA